MLTRCDLCVFTNKDSDLDGVRARGEFWQKLSGVNSSSVCHY